MQSKRRLINCITLLSILSIFGQTYDLGENLLINGDFKEPVVETSNFFTGSPLTIPGWHCSDQCQIDNCTYKILDFVRGKLPYPNCTGQVLDVDAVGKIQNVSQEIQLNYGYYNLSFDYFWPFQSAYKKTFLVYFNDELIFTERPQLNAKIDRFNFTTIVIGRQGNNRLLFTQSKESYHKNDGVGFRITNVSLRSMSNKFLQSLLNATIDSGVSTNINLLPGSRAIFGQLMNMFINLDRYQFYYYHNRTYSNNALQFLKGISLLLKQKGSLLSTFLNNTKFNQNINDFVSSLDYKIQYSDASYISKDSTGTGFILNNAPQIIMSIPCNLLLLFVANLFYVITKKYNVGMFLKKYTMYVILLLMLIEGNVEQYSYYMFAELSNFFSSCFRHKILNVVLVMFFFVFISSSIGMVWLIVLHYRKKGKALLSRKFNNFSFMLIMVEKGILCILLGAIHSLLAQRPNFQLCMLIGVQVCFLLLKTTVIYNNFSEGKLEYLINICEGTVRMLLQFQFYFQGQQAQIKNKTESKLLDATIYAFLVVWGFSCLHAVCQILNFLFKTIHLLFNRLFSPRKIRDSQLQQCKKPIENICFDNVKMKVKTTPKQKYHFAVKYTKKRENRIKLVYQQKTPNKVQSKQEGHKQTVRPSKCKPDSLGERSYLKNKQINYQSSAFRLKSLLEERKKNKNIQLFVNYRNSK